MKKDVSAAFFDIDHTLTRHSTAIRCVILNLRRRKIPLRFLFSVIKPYIDYKKGLMTMESCDDMIDGMDGISRDTLDDMGFTSFERYSQRDLYPDMVELVRDYQKAGVPVVLATSSPQFVAAPYHSFLKTDHLISTELAFDDKGYTSGRFAGPVAFDKGKRQLVSDYMDKMGYEPARCAFYSDSVHDLPTLELSGHPVATNPDRALEKIARDRDWDILRST